MRIDIVLTKDQLEELNEYHTITFRVDGTSVMICTEEIAEFNKINMNI